jgi:hypothetical protein
VQEQGCQVRVAGINTGERVPPDDLGGSGGLGVSAADWAAIGRLVLSETQRRTRDELRRREEGWRPSPYSIGEVLS